MNHPNLLHLLNCHGGVTFTDKWTNDNPHIGGHAQEDLWYIGFDCTHYFDRNAPKYETYVTSEIEKLSAQLARIVEVRLDKKIVEVKLRGG